MYFCGLAPTFQLTCGIVMYDTYTCSVELLYPSSGIESNYINTVNVFMVP